jgi:hypothetical protein
MEVKVNKARNWFLTINENAECFSKVKELCSNIEKCQYSLILHDKDNEEQPHFHVCILYENARTFEQVQKKFYGAHIELMESKYKSFRYLLHLDDTDKYQYDISEVIERGNNVSYYSTHDEYIKLDTESVLENISNGTIRDFYDAVKLFGIKQATTYRNAINELLASKIEKSYTSEIEVMRLNTRIADLEEETFELSEVIAKQLKHIDDLNNINHSLMIKYKETLNQLLEYQKMISERGLL